MNKLKNVEKRYNWVFEKNLVIFKIYIHLSAFNHVKVSKEEWVNSQNYTLWNHLSVLIVFGVNSLFLGDFRILSYIHPLIIINSIRASHVSYIQLIFYSAIYFNWWNFILFKKCGKNIRVDIVKVLQINT